MAREWISLNDHVLLMSSWGLTGHVPGHVPVRIYEVHAFSLASLPIFTSRGNNVRRVSHLLFFEDNQSFAEKKHNHLGFIHLDQKKKQDGESVEVNRRCSSDGHLHLHVRNEQQLSVILHYLKRLRVVSNQGQVLSAENDACIQNKNKCHTQKPPTSAWLPRGLVRLISLDLSVLIRSVDSYICL